MKFHPLYLGAALLAATLGLAACSKQDTPSDPSAAATPASAKRAVSLETIAAEAKGFVAGAVMSSNTVYVFFDPQCPHCAHLWQTSQPLQAKIKFVWVPVAFLSQVSGTQGAAILMAADPVKAMNEHEQLLAARQGGISASANPPQELQLAIRRNTALMTDFGAESVPYIVAKNAQSGQLVTHSGALDTAALASFLGVPLS
jgi:thiol:disulfide interchange protein DsbG